MNKLRVYLCIRLLVFLPVVNAQGKTRTQKDLLGEDVISGTSHGSEASL